MTANDLELSGSIIYGNRYHSSHNYDFISLILVSQMIKLHFHKCFYCSWNDPL